LGGGGGFWGGGVGWDKYLHFYYSDSFTRTKEIVFLVADSTQIMLPFHIGMRDYGLNIFNIQSNPVITTSVYATPRI
jgi:hypothetical protein